MCRNLGSALCCVVSRVTGALKVLAGDQTQDTRQVRPGGLSDCTAMLDALRWWCKLYQSSGPLACAANLKALLPVILPGFRSCFIPVVPGEFCSSSSFDSISI